jgi:hypothetical protein
MFVVAAVSLTCACGDDGGNRRDDVDAAVPDAACMPGAVSFVLEQPADFACHENFTFMITATNNSCEPLVIQNGVLSAEVLTGDCVPAGDALLGAETGPPVGTIPPGQTQTFYMFDGNPFCCTSPGCPATFDCDERFTVTLQTSAGEQEFANDGHVSLGNCNEICP